MKNIGKLAVVAMGLALLRKRIGGARLSSALFLLATAVAAPAADYTYTTNPDGTITITSYTGPGGAVVIPSSIDGKTVTGIGDSAFDCNSLTSVTIPDRVTNIGSCAFYECYRLTGIMIPGSVTSIGDYAFGRCNSLTGVYFQGNAPSIGWNVFYGDNNATVYYLPGTTGWTSTFDGRPTALWTPQIQTSIISVGVRTNRFGFTITGTTNIPIVVEACTNLASASWTPLQSCTITNGSIYFSDATWANYPRRFYRVRSP